MIPKMRLLFAGGILLGLALFLLMLVSVMYWPLQAAVQVVAPFLGISVLASAGLSLLFIALLGPRGSFGEAGDTAGMSSVDRILAEMKDRRR